MTHSTSKNFLEFLLPKVDGTLFYLKEFSGSEAISQLFNFNLVLVANNLAISPAELIGKKTLFAINHTDEPRYFNGIISRFKAGAINGSNRCYELEVIPALGLLGFASASRIFTQKNALEIVQIVLNEYQIKYDLQAVNHQKLIKRKYCIQYQETHLNFIQRLLEEEGLSYYFKQGKDAHTLVVVDNTSLHSLPCMPEAILFDDSGKTRLPHIGHWESYYSFYSGKNTQLDYNYQIPTVNLMAQSSAMTNNNLPLANHYGIFEYPGNYNNADDANLLVQKRCEAQAASFRVVTGTSNIPEFAPGYYFNFAGLNTSIKHDANKYLLTAITHYAYDNSSQLAKNAKSASQKYSNTFTAIPRSTVFRPLRKTPKPCIAGCQTAIVVGNNQKDQEINVNEYGAIQVQFFWNQNSHEQSCPIRVTQDWSAVFHPRIGQEVVVIFENGDPDRALVLGKVFNSNDMPPYALASNHALSYIKTQSTPHGYGRYNELHFDDTQGKEKIHMHAQNDLTIEVQKDTIMTANQSIKLAVGNNSLVINQQGISVNGALVKINKT